MKKGTKRAIALVLALLLLAAMAGCDGEEITPTSSNVTTAPDPATYTFRDYLLGTPTHYDPLSWETEYDRYVLRHTTMGLYDMVPGETAGSIAFVAEMASGQPRDVSEKYAGNEMYGVPVENFEGYAWEIDLNPNAVWEDGVPITADTYIYSMMQLLDPAQKHSRAAAYCSGRFAIRNADNYYRQDQVGQIAYATLQSLGYTSVEEARTDGYENFYLDMTGFWHLDCGYVDITDKTEYRDETVQENKKEDAVSAKYLYDKYLKTGKGFSDFQAEYIAVRTRDVKEVTWADVGLKKSGEYQLTLFLESPVSAEELKYNLTSNWIVPAGYTPGVYGTDSDDYLSYGPYRLVSTLPGINLRLEKNENWYGYSDGKHEGQFQTTHIFTRIMQSEDVAVEAFLAGQIDRLSTTGSRIGAEGLRNYVIEPQSYTSKLTFNTDPESLQNRQSPGISKILLADVRFRQAISMVLDREKIAKAVSPVHEPAYGLLNSSYIAGFSLGQPYRQTEQARQALDQVFAREISAAEVREAAKALFLEAYNAAVKAKKISGTDMIRFDFVVYGDGAVYQNIVSGVQQSIDAALAGTELEGRIKIDLVADANYYGRARTGDFDIILSTLGGSTMDPYMMMENYCDPDRLFEYGFKPDQERLTLTLGEEVVTKTYRRWYWALCYGAYANADPELRTTILAALEQGILQQYRCIPVYSRNTAIFYGERIVPPGEDGGGGIWQGSVRHMAFLYEDEK